MTRIFPEAKDYKTIAVPISEEQRKAIEKKLGFELLPGQQDRFQYFEMTGTEGEVIGIIIAASQKGQYGAVEFVFGLDNDFTIRDIYVQRARERNSSFKKRAFLDLFKGQSIREADNVETIYSGESTPGTEAVFRGIVKEIVAFNILVPKN